MLRLLDTFLARLGLRFTGGRSRLAYRVMLDVVACERPRLRDGQTR